MVVGIYKELIENFNSIKTDLETMKKYQPKMKNTISGKSGKE